MLHACWLAAVEDCVDDIGVSNVRRRTRLLGRERIVSYGMISSMTARIPAPSISAAIGAGTGATGRHTNQSFPARQRLALAMVGRHADCVDRSTGVGM